MSDHVARFQAAVMALARHGHIKQRLINAYDNNLDEICDEDLPVAVRQSFADLREQLHRVSPLAGERPVCASVRKMSVEEASDCAESLVALYAEVVRVGDPAQAVLPLPPEERQGVPPFLVKTN